MNIFYGSDTGFAGEIAGMSRTALCGSRESLPEESGTGPLTFCGLGRNSRGPYASICVKETVAELVPESSGPTYDSSCSSHTLLALFPQYVHLDQS